MNRAMLATLAAALCIALAGCSAPAVKTDTNSIRASDLAQQHALEYSENSNAVLVDLNETLALVGERFTLNGSILGLGNFLLKDSELRIQGEGLLFGSVSFVEGASRPEPPKRGAFEIANSSLSSPYFGVVVGDGPMATIVNSSIDADHVDILGAHLSDASIRTRAGTLFGEFEGDNFVSANTLDILYSPGRGTIPHFDVAEPAVRLASDDARLDRLHEAPLEWPVDNMSTLCGTPGPLNLGEQAWLQNGATARLSGWFEIPITTNAHLETCPDWVGWRSWHYNAKFEIEGERLQLEALPHWALLLSPTCNPNVTTGERVTMGTGTWYDFNVPADAIYIEMHAFPPLREEPMLHVAPFDQPVIKLPLMREVCNDPQIASLGFDWVADFDDGSQVCGRIVYPGVETPRLCD